MIELIYAGVWLAGILAAWDMVRKLTGTRDYLKIAARLSSIEDRLEALKTNAKTTREGHVALFDEHGKQIHALEAKVPELERQIASVRGMIPAVKRVGLGLR